MELMPLTFQETFQLIQELNGFADEYDEIIINTQRQYTDAKAKLVSDNGHTLSKFNSDCEAAITAVKTKSQCLISDAQKIQSEMRSIDQRLSSIDKYYVKTKSKKEVELTGVKNDRYDCNGDYFDTLTQIKKDYAVLSRKYSEDILPSLINGLNYLFSNKRKKDYEELIILLNTVDAFIKEMDEVLPELTAETVAELRSSFEQQRSDLEKSQKRAVAHLDEQYMKSMNNIAVEIDARLDSILPDELVNYIAYLTNGFIQSYGKINSTCFVANSILSLGLVDYPISSYIQSQTLASFINERCKKLIVNGSIKFPLICSTSSPLPLYIKKDSSNAEALRQLVLGVMFSFLSSVRVSQLRLSVIDCENHGNNVEPFFDAKRKMPSLFDDKFYTTYEDATEKIKSLSEEVERILQNQLGTQYASIFEYAKNNPDIECEVELLTLFDFPKGLNEQALSALKNIILHGARCGIYVLIVESNEMSADAYSKEFMDSISKIKKECVMVQPNGNAFSIMGLQYLYYSMPSRNDFNTYFSKYLLINEGIKNRGIAFPPLLKNLIDSKDEVSLMRSIKNVQDVVDAYDTHYGSVPVLENVYPEQVVIGLTHYPEDVFADSYGFAKIKSQFGDKNGRVALPLLLDLNRAANILLSCSESKDGSVMQFTHSIIWNFLSSLPVTKANVVVFDADKKGGSVVPFLDFKKKCPDVFDDTIYTNSDDIYERLNKANRYIDNLIQDKLGNRFSNLLEYNRNTPARAEAITLFVICDFPSGFDTRSLALLKNILKNGGKCGIYAIVCYNQDVHYSSYDNIDEYIETYKAYCSSIELRDKNYMLLPFNLPISIKEPIKTDTISHFTDEYFTISQRIKNKGLSFSDILDGELFSKDYSSGLSIPVGIGDGERVVPITFGVGSSHHALIAGATGSGKSTLLHTLIMSSMLHYSPDLLHLYLMDFKSGTEFKIYESKRLPHIKLLALDAMQEFGESILENLVAEMGTRSEKFKSVGASKLGEYVKISGNPMPKILVIMDEFQVLYNDSTNRKVAYNCAELTKRIVTEGRSFGIHLLMATQSTKIISDLTLATGTVEQMRIRIGLKCGEWDANYLFTERNDAAALEMMKGPIGTAVMNPEYTEENLIGFRAAYCDDQSQEKYLELISNSFSNYDYDLQTFEGSRTVPLFDTDYGKAGLSSDFLLTIEMGTLIKVAPPFKITFDRRRKHNTLICGSNDRMSENLANLYSLAVLKNENSKLYCFDGERLLGPSAADVFYDEYSRFGTRFILAESRGDIIQSVNEIYDIYSERKKKTSNEQVFVLIKNLQFLDIIKAMLKGEPIDEADFLDVPSGRTQGDDTFDFGADIGITTPNVSEKLLKLIDDGTAYGIHFIITSLEYQSVKESMYFGENILAKFPERYVFSLSDSDSESLIENISVSALRDNTVYFSDSVKNTFQLKPYVFPSAGELHDHIDTIMIGGDA